MLKEQYPSQNRQIPFEQPDKVNQQCHLCKAYSSEKKQNAVSVKAKD